MKIKDFIADLVDAGYIDVAQDIEDATSDLESDTTVATGELLILLKKANTKIYCPLGF